MLLLGGWQNPQPPRRKFPKKIAPAHAATGRLFAPHWIRTAFCRRVLLGSTHQQICSLVSTAQLLLSRLPTKLIRTSAPQHSRVTFRASSQVLSPFLIALSHRPFPFSPLHLFRFEQRPLSTRSQRFCSTAPPVPQLTCTSEPLPTAADASVEHTGPPTLLRVRSWVV